MENSVTSMTYLRPRAAASFAARTQDRGASTAIGHRHGVECTSAGALGFKGTSVPTARPRAAVMATALLPKIDVVVTDGFDGDRNWIPPV